MSAPTGGNPAVETVATESRFQYAERVSREYHKYMCDRCRYNPHRLREPLPSEEKGKD